MASPLSPVKDNTSVDPNPGPGGCTQHCTQGHGCLEVCTPISKRSAEADLSNRKRMCGGSLCLLPVCEGPFCSLDGCADAPACQNTTSKRSQEAPLVERQLGCPPGIPCGHGPACTPATCDLPGCADADVCQDQDQKRDVVERGFGCPPGIPCGHGPVCTATTCGLPGCADADVCVSKREAKTEIIRPICDICRVTDKGVVECCGTIVPGALERRDSEKICPLFCITTEEGDTLCGCAAQDYQRSLQTNGTGGLERRDPKKLCPLFCITTEEGNEICGCAAQDYLKSLQENGPEV